MNHARCVVIAAGIALFAWPASAQTIPRVEIAAGYTRLTDASASLNTTTGRPSMNGWNVEIATAKSRRMSWVGVIDGARGRDDGQSPFGDRNTWRDLSAAGGIRWTGRWNERVIPYAQLLGGAFQTTQTYRWKGSMQDANTKALLIQPGIGATVMLNPRMGVRLGVDMKVLPNFDWVDEAAGQSMSRVFLGGVVALGRKSGPHPSWRGRGSGSDCGNT